MVQVIGMEKIKESILLTCVVHIFINLNRRNRKMNNVANFNTFLQNGIGLTQVRQRDAVTNHGFDTCSGLLNTTKDGIKDVFTAISNANRDIAQARNKVYIREQLKQRVYGAKDEFTMRINCGSTIDTAYLTAIDTNDTDQFVRKHQEWNEFKKSVSSMTLPNVTVPKLTKSNWKNFSQAIKQLLTRQRGVNEIPLVYVIRDGNGNYDDVYNSTEEQLIHCIQLSGGKYRSDNGTVWSLLAEHSVGTEAESIVNRYESTKNGRSAWRALIQHMESTSYMDNIRSRAMSKLASATYNGEKKNFGIVKFYQIHSEAHNDLELAGEPLTDGMKITHFLQGIKEDTAMNFAISTKAEAAVVTFEDFYNSFSAKLSTKLTLTASSHQGSNRNISQLNSQYQGRGYGRRGGFSRGGNRGGGRYQGRGNRGGRGGRGRHGSGQSYRYNPTQRWQPRASTYSPDEWSALSEEQRMRVRDLRSALNSNDNNQQNQQRQASQMNRDDESLPTQIQLPPVPSGGSPVPPSNQSQQQDSVSAPGGRAGDAFSSGRNNQSGGGRG